MPTGDMQQPGAAPARPSGRALLVPLAGVLLVILYLALQVFRPFLLDFTAAVGVTLLLAPAQRRLRRALRGHSSIAAGLLVLLVSVLILLPVISYGALLGQQALAVYDWVRPRLQPEALSELWRTTLPERYPGLAEWIRRDEAAFMQVVSSALSRLASAANGLVQNLAARLTTAIFDLFLFLMMVFFLLRDGPRLRAELSRLSPLSEEQEEEVLGGLERTVKGVLQAMVVVPLLQGALAAPGFALFGLPSPMLWGLMVVVAAMVPLLGTPLAWVPAVVYLLLEGAPTWQWAGMLAWGMLLISGIDNFVKPLILSETAQVHPLLGFLAILGGVLSFGAAGFLVGPMILSLGLSGVRIYRSDVLGRAVRPRAAAAS